MIDIINQFREFKAFEAVFSHDEKTLQKIHCGVSSVEDDKILIDASNKRNTATASVGDELKLYIYTENGIYTAYSRVLEVDRGLLLTKYTIEYPTETKHSQRRDYYRVNLAVKLNIEAHPKDTTQEKFIESAYTKNICGKGMCYISKYPFPKYYESIKISLYFDTVTIETEASLVHTTETLIANEIKYIHAFNFTTITRRDTDFIVKKCFMHQLEVRKQEKERLL